MGQGGNRTAGLLRGVLDTRAGWEKMYSEGRDFGDMGERSCTMQNCRRCRPPAGGPSGDCDGTRAGSLP